MGQDDPPNYDAATLVTVPLDGLEPLKHLAAFQVRFWAPFAVDVVELIEAPAAEVIARAQ